MLAVTMWWTWGEICIVFPTVWWEGTILPGNHRRDVGGLHCFFNNYEGWDNATKPPP